MSISVMTKWLKGLGDFLGMYDDMSRGNYVLSRPHSRIEVRIIGMKPKHNENIML